MEERLVEWTLVLNHKYLEKILNRKLKRKLARQLTLNCGKLDLLYEDDKETIIVIELKLGLKTDSDWASVKEQLLNYLKEINKRVFPDRVVEGIILCAQEDTELPVGVKNKLKPHKISVKTYSIEHIQKLYSQTIEKLVRNSGLTLDLGTPTTIGVRFLRYLNKMIGAFQQSDTLTKEEIRIWMKKRNFGHSDSRIGHIYLMAKYFGLMNRKNQVFSLTWKGKLFKDDINLPTGLQDLSVGQKRILLESLLKGVNSPIKALIFWFLRFVSLTGGKWVPKSSTKIPPEKHLIVNTLMGTELNATSVKDMLNWACNYCEELDLAKRLEGDSQYDGVILTSLGSRVHYFLENLLILKRETVQIPLEAY